MARKPTPIGSPGRQLAPFGPGPAGTGTGGQGAQPAPTKTPTKASGNGVPSGTSNPGGTGSPPAVSGTGIGLLAVAGLGAIALANTAVGPVVIAALVAAVIWNGNQLIGVIGTKAPAASSTITAAGSGS